MNYKSILGIALMTAFILSCKQQPQKIEIKTTQISIDSLQLASIGDTVIDDMVVKNPDPENAWVDTCLRGIHRKEFIDGIFEDIYQQKLLAYDFFTGKVLTVEQVKKLEKTENYNRDIIGKFQFRESWLYDRNKHVFIKKVQSIVLGYETYIEGGIVKGYKPLLIVKF